MYKNKAKAYISALLAAVIIICSLSVGFFAYGADTAISVANFPDSNWRQIVLEYFDENGNGYLSSSEVAGVTFISISGLLEDICGEDSQIETLRGIEKFTDLKRLRCGGIGLEELDVITQMPQLVELNCEGNNLTSINLSNNTALQWLNCASNDLTALNVSMLTGLTRLDCYTNSIESLNVSPLSNLTELRCYSNELTSLNLSSNTLLSVLNCSNNHLMTLDLSNNTALEDIIDYNIGGQQLTLNAEIDGTMALVTVDIPNYQNITRTSVDRIQNVGGDDVTILGYDGVDFVVFNGEDLAKGIDYYYNTGLEASVDMHVHINIVRDFYQVSFYTNETKQELISKAWINEGNSAAIPDITPYVPLCKSFAGWSEDATGVDRDKEVYALWNDAHAYDITSFVNNTATVTCSTCANSYTVVFSQVANKKSADNGFDPIIDRNNDGVINGKDYALLLRMFK